MLKEILIAITAILLLTAVIILFSYQSDFSRRTFLLEFALRHPDWISTLVLISAVVHKEKPMDFKDKIIHHVILKSDFLFWMFKYFESSSYSFFGVPPEVQASMVSLCQG